jgi:hypothetical protein
MGPSHPAEKERERSRESDSEKTTSLGEEVTSKSVLGQPPRSYPMPHPEEGQHCVGETASDQAHKNSL